MYCPKCGKELKEGAKFCTNCSYAVSGDSQDDVPPKNSKGKTKWPVIIAVATLLILIVLVSLVAVPGVNRMRYQSFLKAGNRYLTEMNYEEAVVAFTKAIEIEEKEASAYYGRGNAYFGLARQAESKDDMWSYNLQAEEDYYVALDLDEMMTDAYEALSEVYLAWDEWEEALDILEFGYEVTGERKLSEKAATVRDLVTAENENPGTDLGGDGAKENAPIVDDEEDSMEEEMPVILAVESGNTMMEGSKPLHINENGYIDARNEDYEYVFNTDIPRRHIRKIEFMDHLDEKPSDAWDISALQDGSVWIWFTPRGNDYDLFIAGEGGVDGNSDCSCLFYGYEKLESIEFNHCFYTGNVTDMSFMFKGCSSLKELNLNCFDTSKVTNMAYMLSACSIEEKDGFSALIKLNLDSFATSQVVNMSGMFYGCWRLEELDLGNFDTSQVSDMSFMFGECSSMKALDVRELNTSQVTNMSCMFSLCSSMEALDVSGFNTSQVTDMSCMFSHCSSLEDLDLSNFNTSQVTNMEFMFASCESLQKINMDHFDTSHVINMREMFQGCSSLQDLNFDALDMTSVSNDYDMFKDTQWE